MFYSPKRKKAPENEPIEEKGDNISKEKENENNKDDNNIKNDLNEVEEYELEFDDEKYNLKAGYSKEKDSISLKITPLDSKNTKDKNYIIFYEGLFSSQDLTKLCKSFRMYDSIEEIFSAFCEIFENKKAYLKQNNENEKDDNLLSLVIIVGSATGKEDEICLNLEKKEIKIITEEKKEEIKNENENNIVINNQCNCNCKIMEKEIKSKIEKIEKDLGNENYELKNEIFYLKDDINRYKKTIDSNKKEIKNLKTQIKELKNSFEGKLKTLSDKINSLSSLIINNSNNDNDIINNNGDNNIVMKDNSNNITKINKEEYDSKNIKNNNTETNIKNNNKTNNPLAIQKKDLNKLNKNISNNPKKNSKPLISPTSKLAKNQDKKANNKREIYQQMKAANAQKLSNIHKEKASFGEFLKQKKNSGGNKVIQSIEVKEPLKEKKKVLQKNNTDFLPETSKVKVSQPVFVNRNRNISEDEKDKQEKQADDNTNNNNNEYNYKEEEEIEELNINENLNINNENVDKDGNELEKENDYEIQRIKAYDVNRGDIIDQWKFDFDLNVKKLLQDNESKLKLAEKLNKMNRRIINNINELQLIENKLYKEYSDTKEIEYTLLYRASEDGDKSEIFHEKCDTPYTLTIIRNMDGTKFGGYTEESWEGKSNKKDYHSFCFSLTKNKIYNSNPEKNAIICDPDLAPSFGGPLFKVFNNFFTKGGKCFPKNKCGFIGQDNDFEITNGIEDFEIHEIEVYQINLN